MPRKSNFWCIGICTNIDVAKFSFLELAMAEKGVAMFIKSGSMLAVTLLVLWLMPGCAG